MSGSGDYYLTITISPDPGFTLDLDSMVATEELGRPFLFELELSSVKANGDLKPLLGRSVTVAAKQQGGQTRYYNGIVARIVFIGMSGGAYRYRMELRPWIWLLSHTQDCAIFQNKTAFSIITDGIFRAKQFTNFEDKRQSQSGDIQLEYCVQYRETALDFVTRLMEQFGIYYYFKHSDGNHTLVLADDPNSHVALPKAIPYLLNQAEYRGVEDHVWDCAADMNLQSGAYTMRDYNFTIPAADLTGKLVMEGGHPNGTLEVYDYPAWYKNKSDGQKLAAVRMQDLAARRQVFSGVSNARGIYAGCKFTISGYTESSMNREYLVIAATTSFSLAEGLADTGGDLTDTYRCVFQAIPGDTVFRLPPLTPRPTVHGPQTAKVVGASGEEITTDSYGRVKVKFYWDRSPGQDENSSCWIRVSQLWAGNNWGAMFIPRIGQEVIVDFIEGNPDRPIITGRVYNANQGAPYTLPDNATRSTIMSNSSKGGGGSNELRFEDKAGSEEVFFHAQKDYHRVVLNNETIDITQDSTTTVSQGKRSVTVSAKDNVLTVSQGNNATTVSTGNDSLTVSTGNHSITVSAGSSSITAAQSIKLTVGANSITIDTSGVTIQAAQVSVTSTGPTSINATGPASLQSSAEVTIAGATVMIN
jgi:type VI secretion system secreted protein VgrG